MDKARSWLYNIVGEMTEQEFTQRKVSGAMTVTVHLHVFFDSSLRVDVVEHMAASATA